MWWHRFGVSAHVAGTGGEVMSAPDKPPAVKRSVHVPAYPGVTEEEARMIRWGWFGRYINPWTGYPWPPEPVPEAGAK